VSSTLSDAEYRSLAEFRHALRVFLRFSEDAARQAGMTPNQHQLLLAVRGASRAPSIAEMAEALQLKHHSVVELVQRAEQAGLLTRVDDPQDRRHHLLRLTAVGEARLSDLSRLHRRELRRFRRQLTDILQELS
jgi:DNA-binding MarR family transcriptional regulator